MFKKLFLMTSLIISLSACEESKESNASVHKKFDPCDGYDARSSVLQCNDAMTHCLICTYEKCINFNPNNCDETF